MPLTRRRLLASLAAGAAAPMLAGCEENPAIGRSQFILVDDAYLAEMSAATWRQVLAEAPRSADAGLGRRLETIGARVVAAAGLETKAWEFVVLADDTPNAFVLPGGKVAFNEGLLRLTANDSQIAAVMGHEVAHVAARHAAERVSQTLVANAATTVASFLLQINDVAFANELAGALGAGVTVGVILPFSRQHESEADILGLRMMQAAGFDPVEAVAFWSRMQAAARGAPVELLSTHPSDERRIEGLREELQRMGIAPRALSQLTAAPCPCGHPHA